ncbi:MAG: hypothetical protein JW836_07540 [Deltaproteobacteria bacterium]|nr:hypothetical protein [Deltaproteobacteria bacterium]
MTLQRKKMVILTGYIMGESYGLLGPQLAATIIQEHSPYDCIVAAVTREDDKKLLKQYLADFFGREKPLIAFSYLGGREDLYRFAKELKDEGALTILAGPQSDLDYLGEDAWQDHPHRFQGLSEFFSVACHGPAEQILPFLKVSSGKNRQYSAGMLWRNKKGAFFQKSRSPWNPVFLKKVLWNNLYRVGENDFCPHKITTAQVLWHIGCPYAASITPWEIDYPSFLATGGKKTVKIPLRGCSFCDVGADKGFFGALNSETLLHQIRGLPEKEDGRKIPFELINENALSGLYPLLQSIISKKIPISQINLTLRADWFIRSEARLRKVLKIAKDMEIRILLASVGFESFDSTILANLHKGVDTVVNLKAIRLMREMKHEFPEQWGYSKSEGAVHGFIHPTPWDTYETEMNNRKIILLYGLSLDILPEYSVPLIIHHGSALGNWVREIETRETIQFKREGTIIGWWQAGDRFVL